MFLEAITYATFVAGSQRLASSGPFADRTAFFKMTENLKNVSLLTKTLMTPVH